MSEMIERVAEAVWRAEFEYYEKEPPCTYAKLSRQDRRLMEHMARAAIEAMRELTPVVRDHEGYPAHQLVGAPEDIWRTLLDAVLITRSSASSLSEHNTCHVRRAVP